MIAFKLTFVLSATIFSVASLTYAAPTTYRVELTFEDPPELFFARDSQHRPTTLEGVTSTFASTVKPHIKGKKVLAGVASGKRQHIYSKNYHRYHVLNGANKPAKYVTTASQMHELDSALNKRHPAFPSKHHCPICHKSPKAGYCKDHQWVCDDHDGRPWVQTTKEKCEKCGNSPPTRGKKNRSN